MKTTKLTHALWVAALAMLFGGCASDNEPTSPAGKDTGNPIQLTFIASTPDDNSGQTRVAYDDKNLKLTWQEGDRLRMEGLDDMGLNIGSEYYTYQGIPGATSGNFTGNEIASAEVYNAYYPGEGFPIDVQKQKGDDNTDHLKNYILLRANDIIPGEPFTLKMTSSIMKFHLSNLPTIGKLRSLKWTVETEDGEKSQQLDFEDVTINVGTNSLTAYLGFMPQDMVVKAGGKFTVFLIGDNICQAQVTINGGKTYEPGHRYTATMNGEWKEMAQMKFAVKMEDGALELRPPFKSVPIPADMIIDWGDGTLLWALSGTKVYSLHQYTSAGEYTVTIYSTQTDAAEKQIPAFDFGYVGSKLIRIDTPLLNTGETDLSSCFSGCRSLTSVPADLFDNHSQITNFSSCFSACSSLANIPAELFVNHSQATDFSSCFSACSSLANIPVELFTNHSQATDFSSCFATCSSLTEIPAELFAQNTKAKTFYSCFNASGLTTIPGGLFDNNPEVTDFSYCFVGCKITEIPAGLFAKNTVATNFSRCFVNCKKLKLNPFIFGFKKGTQEEDTERFSGMAEMNFEFCFYGVGIDAGEEAGTAPELWNYAKMDGANWITSYCFTGVTDKLTNYNNIFRSWGGPATDNN